MTRSNSINPDHTLYLVICAHRNGPYVVEREVCDMDRATTLQHIKEGQFGSLARVIEFNTAEFSSRDVTEDMARDAMLAWALNDEPLTEWQYEFVDMHVSTQAANSFQRVA
jgi:hypothetical protein